MAIGSLYHLAMRSLTIALATLGVAAIAEAGAQSPVGNATECGNATTQARLTECFTQRARASDSALTRAYRSVLSVSKGKRRELLRTSQRVWLAYREAYCRFDAAQYEGGSQYASEFGACLTELSKVRTEELLSDASAERETGGAAPRDR